GEVWGAKVKHRQRIEAGRDGGVHVSRHVFPPSTPTASSKNTTAHVSHFETPLSLPTPPAAGSRGGRPLQPSRAPTASTAAAVRAGRGRIMPPPREGNAPERAKTRPASGRGGATPWAHQLARGRTPGRARAFYRFSGCQLAAARA